MKQQPLDTSNFRQLVTDDKYCAITARIFYECQLVRFMYREEPISETDSGWQFLDGTETEDYLANPNNAAMYRLNTIANLDAAVIPYLDFSIGTDLERLEGSNNFIIVN